MFIRVNMSARETFSAPSVCGRGDNVALPFQHFVMRRRLVFVIIGLAIIFPHREIFELVPHQDPPEIGMTFEMDAVKIEDLALLKFRAPPDRSE